MSEDGPGPMLDPLTHPICLAWPERRTAVAAWHEHIPFAMLLVDLLQPAVLVELGVHAGDSYCAFCQAVKQLNLDTRCYGIDTWRGDAHSGLYGNDVLDDLRAHHDSRYGTFSSLIPRTFDDALQGFADGTIGVLHIDGYHGYEAVKHDFESWLPKMRPDGVVLLHDTNVRERGFEVARFWDEVKGRYRSFEFLNGHGLGVLALGEIRSPELAAMLEATLEETERIRRFFAQLGQRVSLRDQVDALRSRVEQLRQPEDPQSPNLIQLFWDDAGKFSEGESLAVPLVADDQIHDYVLPLPPTARGPLRLDPGNRPAYVEIRGIELRAGGEVDGADAEVVCRWSAAAENPRLVPLAGIRRLSGSAVCRFLCTSKDPQLLLDGVPRRDDPRPWFVRVAMRTSEPVLDADERGGLAEVEGGARLLSACLTEHERLFEASWAEWRAERTRLEKQLAEHEQEQQSRARELAHARADVTGLQARTAQQDAALAASRAENAALTARVEEAAHAEQSLFADLGARERALVETQRRLRSREDLLRRIAVSRGWWALNCYRWLKHRLLDPVRRIVHVWEAFAGREYHPRLAPTQELSPLDDRGSWQATDRDPQFEVVGSWPKGWAEVTLDLAWSGPVSGRARLYVDRRQGFHEHDSYELGEGGGLRTRFVRLGPEVIALRLDPCESTGRFRIVMFSLKRVTARRARRGNGSAEAPNPGPSSVALARLVPEPPARNAAVLPRALDPYEAWLEVNRWSARRAAWLNERLSGAAAPPLLSVVMPVYDPPPEFLDKAIASVVAQVYPHWELCIADDASTDPAVRGTLKRWTEREPRIRVVVRGTNGHISRATNSAADVALGEFLVLMDHDDELTPDALGEVALYLSGRPETDVLYSDDDKIDAQGRRFAPQFKPDWSPELLLSYMYWSHLLVVRRSIFVELGGLRVGYEGAQDYDFALRLTEVTDRVGHIPKVLYHWRALPASTAASGQAKPEGFRAGVRAVQDALDRRGIRAVAYQPDWAVQAACGIFSHEFPNEGPSVAVIIPTRNNLRLLKACLDSLETTTYKNYEVIIVDNGSDAADVREFFGRTHHRVLRIPNAGARFNFAAINDRAVEETDAECVLFLNDDTEIVTPAWLSQMVGYLGLPGVGAVGARLRLPDGRLQHAGIVHGYYHGLAGPAFKLLPGSAPGYLSYTMVARNYAAVTAACLLTKRELFRELGGFDAESFAIAYNDVDYCYRLRAAGHRVVYCPTAELVHHEGASRGFADDPAEPAAFRRKYGGWRDPYYNPNLSLGHERFAVDARAVVPERAAPIRVLMCAFTLNWEGAAYSQLELTVGLKERGVIEPIVYCPQEGRLRKAYEAQGIRVEVFAHPLRGARDAASYEEAVMRFAEWIQTLDVELVYGNTRQTFYAIDAGKRLGLPSVWNPRESEPWQTYFEYLAPEIGERALQCFAYPYRVVFVADATRDSCAPLDAHHNFVTIHTGLDREQFLAALAEWPRAAARRELNVGPDEVVVLTVGTVCERKGQIDLIDAVARLDEPSASRTKCFVVGDRASEYSARLERARQALPTARRARVEIVAETPDIARYYAASDVFVCSSRFESFPRVILEAMAAGLPIVTTPVYGIAEQVRENVNALCYAPGDVETLARHLERLQREPSLRRALAANSHHVLDLLNDFESMVQAYADVFREAWASGVSR